MKSRPLNARARKHLALTLAAVRRVARNEGGRLTRARQYHRAWKILEHNCEVAGEAGCWGDLWDFARAASAAKSSSIPEGAA